MFLFFFFFVYYKEALTDESVENAEKDSPFLCFFFALKFQSKHEALTSKNEALRKLNLSYT